MIERNIARLHAVKDFISEPNNRLFREDEPARTFSSDGILSDDQKQDAQTPWITIEDLIKQVTAHFDLLTFGSELSNNITTLETQMTASNPNATQEFFQWFNSTIQAIQFS
jgi:hypothetical protein